ncbi:DUF692 domain-containing protein [Flavobacterium sp. HJJ]|uniref:MNIO family bufferin maturase n=1 Tax=Flavobacterium sp. HJJ TaxID=2783792 RepID=UPI00188C8123|nr:DUF692 domain-containing protein [Flavobacterium sp. HJJ]MBF4472416.1 DUF692 domain-containing protein [Flavobacterium sp. HJJ]
MITRLGLPNLGLGLGLRSQHFEHILQNKPEVDWFEVISENFMDSHGRPRYILHQIAEQYPVVMHGVSLSIGSTDPLNFDYLKSLKQLAAEVKPVWISDHLCWTGVLTTNSHDLLPLPLNDESLKHVCDRIRQVQDYLERPLILENPSTYASFNNSTLPEWEFLRLMTEETGCGLLLDVNNVYVSSFNNDFDPVEYINGIPHDKVVQMHLAGHQNCGNYIIDTHDREVTNPVWKLFQMAYQLVSEASVLLEWDGNIPAFDVYHSELLKSKKYMDKAFAGTENEIQSAEKEQISNPLNIVAINQFI